MSGVYNITRPTGEQIEFSSSKTGDHILDDYIEACERGAMTLAELLDKLFDPSTGALLNIIFGVRVSPATRMVEMKVGTSAEASSWLSTGLPIFRNMGTWAEGVQYFASDSLILNGVLQTCNTDHVSGAAADTAKFTPVSPTTTAFMATVLDDPTADTALATLGLTAYAISLVHAANAAAARSTLGFPALTGAATANRSLSTDAAGTGLALVSPYSYASKLKFE